MSPAMSVIQRYGDRGMPGRERYWPKRVLDQLVDQVMRAGSPPGLAAWAARASAATAGDVL
ncbi:hypothetical protein FRACA_1290028 [Frankia canadensis]|uniref:Uncharacterized protein n=1 Tax=Frankia canadensis TaxID=1836972 RepID=A0A2I2KKJ2_9ACTN|nr:hypothetical protein FRACA_1290028 [Frankia canadensis]SOU53465.1 hypothetical protein FRACA_1290028 [Frankia canadensis]